ncbi:MAG: dockerin type I domain-containing protein [Planctomycetota bacterium]
MTTDRNESVAIEATGGLEPIRINLGGGDDQLTIDRDTHVVFGGGQGEDTLELTQIGRQWVVGGVLPALATSGLEVFDVEVINTVGNGSQRLTLEPNGVRRVTDERNELYVRADASDELIIDPSWDVQQPSEFNGVPTHVLSNGDVTLRLSANSPWQNPLDAGDVNANGEVTALDALLIINRLNQHGDTDLAGDIDTILADDGFHFYDVSGDGQATALDALRTINLLNQADQANEVSTAHSEPVVWASAADAVFQDTEDDPELEPGGLF